VAGVGEPADVTDLGDEDGGHDRSDPVDRLDRPVALIVDEPAV
jgi:hypothetical protein